MTDCIQVSFSWATKNVLAKLDAEPLSSDGGLLLVRSADAQLRLIQRAAGFLEDSREPGKVRHEVETLLRQRVFGICAGYEDCNDAQSLCEDPLHELVVGASLASSPTLSRFENAQGWKALKKLNAFLLEVARKDLKRAKEIVIDIDTTDDEAHGKQQLAFFHGYYDHHMFHPVLVYANDRLVFVLLRPGNCHSGRAATPILQSLIRRIRGFSRARLVLRADGGFSLPRLYEMLEAEKVTYTIGLITNPVLVAYADEEMEKAEKRYQETKQPVQRFGTTLHRAESWSHSRRVVFKAERLEKGENRRFVVTNASESPEAVYTFYRQRGNCENRIKDLKNALRSDRTSCHRFVANAFRLLEHALAYVLLDHLRRAISSSELQRMQFDTLRLHLIKIGAIVRSSVRRTVVHLPKSYRWAKVFAQTAKTLAIPIPA